MSYPEKWDIYLAWEQLSLPEKYWLEEKSVKEANLNPLTLTSIYPPYSYT